ncbi:basic amino acid ABC transporter substrate-binding protein [Herbaspirillum lusitanum]|uniref:Basic amino acid ABC transporter substrate-binding protein n=1 Tax=Herbaspirillum lusitanum TaxID=213312 RepID=A0ABW9A714_9BURK
MSTSTFSACHKTPLPVSLRHLLLSLACGLLLAGCGKETAVDGPQAIKTYTVGTDAAYAPMEMQDEKKDIIGFDIELLNAIADKAGFRLRFVHTPFESIFSSLQQGDRDILISSITITDERRQVADFSTPYFEARQLIVAPQADMQIHRFEDLRTRKVAVQTATTGDLLTQKLMGKNNPDIKRFDSMPLAMAELESRGVDAVVADEAMVKYYLRHHDGANFRTLSDPAFSQEHYGIAVRRGNAELLNQINRGLAALKADGTYARISEKYFGTQSP